MQAIHILDYAAACLLAAERELLIFTACFFVLGGLDELLMDLCWLRLRLAGKARDERIDAAAAAGPLAGRAAVFIAAWQEERVIGFTIAHALAAWPQQAVTLYLGCYANDPATITAAIKASGGDPRVRLVIGDRPGPTTKADCLNRVYAALCADEQRYGWRYRSIVLHDAEDMVHPAGLAAIDAALDDADFVQLPVRPELQQASPWIAAHYADEFAELHGKTMVVRDAIGAAIPAAGVGCGFSRAMIARIARRRGSDGPFAAECLTEDYELGLLVQREGGRSRFLRLRDHHGDLVATRAYFPARLEQAVRQKARWVHGIAFQGWDRMGWTRRPADLWMALRDRRGPLIAVVLVGAYALVVVEGVLGLLALAGARLVPATSPVAQWLLGFCAIALAWRCVFRFAFSMREYGLIEGIGAVVRIPVGNIIAILAGRRALWGYFRSLHTGAVRWDKTSHDSHPVYNEVVGATRREALAA